MTRLMNDKMFVKLPTIWTVGKAEVGKVRVEKRKGENIRGQKE